MGKKLAMDDLLSLSKRRGWVFPSSEIYGGLGGFFDYGPLGCELKKNIRDAWWKSMVHQREDVVGIECSVIMNRKVWDASGHVEGFSDPMVDCRESTMRYRADQLFFGAVVVDGRTIGHVSVQEDPEKEQRALDRAKKLQKKMAVPGPMAPIHLRPITDATEAELALIPSPETGTPGALTPPRNFHLMFETAVGALADEASRAYLRPETAQGIFVNFRNVLDTARKKVPFGIAQIGRAFRNEITPRNFIFRSREFEQMELEYFISPDADWEKLHREWVQIRWQWYRSIGIREDLLGLTVHPREKLAHYARACTDITFSFPFGVEEIEGIAARGDFDLSQHQQWSGKSLEYFDEETQRRYLPQVIEPSAGVDRLFLAALCSAYDEDEVDGERRIVLRLHPTLAPIKVAVLPLVKNRPELLALARSIHGRLQKNWNVAFDAAGAIGRRYRRMDEVGTPFCVTVDYESLENQSVTVRNRDSTRQIRVPMDRVVSHVREQLEA
jgi:glycyl-tRNA synthetase